LTFQPSTDIINISNETREVNNMDYFNSDIKKIIFKNYEVRINTETEEIENVFDLKERKAIYCREWIEEYIERPLKKQEKVKLGHGYDV
jgi:hypothetical protein